MPRKLRGVHAFPGIDIHYAGTVPRNARTFQIQFPTYFFTP
nr:MAG TPA: hypothetical protein [Caudoviricetes sp.]